MFLLDSGRRLRKLDFKKAPWEDIRRKLKDIDWSSMSRLASVSPTFAHSLLLIKILPILEALVPVRRDSGGAGGRSRLHRKRKLLWRKLSRVRTRLENATSVQNMAKLLQDRQDLELELKAMYTSMTHDSEAKHSWNEIKSECLIFIHQS